MKTEQQPVVPVWDNRTRTAKRGGFSVKKLDEWIKEGKVETRKFGLGHKGILVRWASVEALIESMPRHQPAAQPYCLSARGRSSVTTKPRLGLAALLPGAAEEARGVLFIGTSSRRPPRLVCSKVCLLDVLGKIAVISMIFGLIRTSSAILWHPVKNPMTSALPARRFPHSCGNLRPYVAKT